MTMACTEGHLSTFLSAYRKNRNVSQAEKESGYRLGTTYPPAGFYVYALIDPANQQIFYIGKGIGGRVAELDILRGWKEIEDFLRMGSKAILRAGYPVRCEQGAAVKRPSVYAFRVELLEHARRGTPPS